MTAKIRSTRSSGFVEISSWKFSECSTNEKTEETIWVISFFVMDPLLSKYPFKGCHTDAPFMVISMLVTDGGDDMCWRHF